ncbi:MAG: class II aldolase/adducin family protein [Desulfuromonadaceae bacterium]|nr:class II aldolase/adducin family protein [Desulfuromonadaceae bacterium]MDD2849720.1 class II aldolase/adducin family protein [Desulfuromonadaceae bacterium]MDD4129823.1 class II aldolase/adducin family protein [Desulfuromonadaceae bacterium]
MRDHILKYTAKLISERSAQAGQIAFAVQDDELLSDGKPFLAALSEKTLSRMNALALVAAVPALPFADFLIQRAACYEHIITPRDTETRTFLHDIPIIRKGEIGSDIVERIATLLGNRKGIVVEGIGIIAAGALTVEQAYINWSSIYHSTFIKYLEDLFENGYMLPGEEEAFNYFRHTQLVPLSSEGLAFRQGPLYEKSDILEEIASVGRYTVQRGLVDSFFGNISYSSRNIIYISQTASSLDELPGCIDPVPFATSSTVGITASSELVAHRAIFEETGCRAILHGHPRFAVVMSMLCHEKESCLVTDCWKDCAKVRFLGDTPVVAGEIGAGGIAKNVPPVIGKTGSTVVYGHGVFSIGTSDFREAFQALVDVENWCRVEYFRLFDEKIGDLPPNLPRNLKECDPSGNGGIE